jgi:protein ImuB
VKIAQAFSPRYECRRADLVSIDVTGLERLFAPRTIRARGLERPVARPTVWKTIGEELVRATRESGVRGHVAIAGTHVAAMVLAIARPGLTVVPTGAEAATLASIPLDVLVLLDSMWPTRVEATHRETARVEAMSATFKRWGLRTLGDLAALPPADLTARLGRQALVWHALARGEDVRPLVPTEPEERFDGTLDLEWPIEGLEPLSFVLTRLLEPLSTRLERRDRGAAVLHITLELVTREVHARHLQLPAPIRDVRTLRTLALLDIEAHPPAGAIDRVEVAIDPTPGRVLQHTLFTRALPTPERLSTLLARLGALMGSDRIGAPATVDTYRPGAFEMRPFSTNPAPVTRNPPAESGTRPPHLEPGTGHLLSALRRCRQPVPARVAIEAGRPVRVTTDRRGFCGGAVVSASGPWRTSGWWWAGAASSPPAWNRDEWDVSLSDGAVYRVFHDRETGGWFIDGVFD